ncbi:MAG TPA: peptidylprolyl isomerase [Pyrinomonadaceae bacterium]
MSSLGKSVILLVLILAIGGGLVFWKTKYGSHHGAGEVSFNSMSKEEMELLLKDANPMMLKRLEDPEVKKQQLDSIKQLLAIASEAKKDPTVYNADTQKAMEIIDAVIWARTYDQEINKDKGPMPPFGFITEDQIKEFYGEGDNTNGDQKAHAKEFDEFLNVQLNFARKNKSVPEDTEPSDEEKAQMKNEFAKIKIYEAEAKAKVKSGELKEDFEKKVLLQSKLQQAQFLSRMYSTDVLAKKSEVTDEDVNNYLAQHPELNTAETKKVKANEVLQRLKNGEDFAALAKEFSEDPGSKDKGGLYEGVTEGGGFDKSFESAALALQPGQFTQELVETPFGYHIIKLERKGEAKDQSGQVKQSYDVRHILFSTMIKDPENPMGREMPVKEFVKQKLEADKEKQVMDELVAANHIEVADNFEIPKVSDEQMQEMMKKQMQQQMPQQMPQPESDPTKPGSKDAKKPEVKKVEPKKK